MADPIITLTTDFGTSDHLVGSMKGVILNINPAARIVDINHSVVPFDILDGALSIANAYKLFSVAHDSRRHCGPRSGNGTPPDSGERGEAIFRRAGQWRPLDDL